MKRIMNIIVLLLCVGILLSIFGCAGREEEKTKKTQDGYGAVGYTGIEFASDSEKEQWRAPLVKLLSGLCANGKTVILDPEATDPELRAEYVPGGVEIALMDLDLDGTPEVLEGYFGGSSGVYSYEVYDLNSGKNIGHIFGSSWCVYMNRESGELTVISDYSFRGGWSYTSRRINKLSIDKKSDKVVSTQYLCASHNFEMVKVEPTKEQLESGFTEAYDEVCTVEYYVNGESSYFEKYYLEYDKFNEDHIRISETQGKPILWDDVATRDLPQPQKAEKMADALLSSGQGFIKQ